MMKQNGHNSLTPGKNPGFCLSDCSACTINRLGDSPRFRQVFLEDGQQIKCGHIDTSHILFLIRGSLQLEGREREKFTLSAAQCYFYTKNEIDRITAKGSVFMILLEFVRRLEICGQDCLKELGESQNPLLLPISSPMLTLNTTIKDVLMTIFLMPGLVSKPCFHHLKMMEVSMMMAQLYTTKELACFFRSIIRPADDFRAFVLTHYNRVQTVAEFAAMSGMSKSVFQKKFVEVFADTVSHWLMKQKAEAIRIAVREGMTSVKVLMWHFGFSTEAVFGRFCKTYLGGSPRQVIEQYKTVGGTILDENDEKNTNQ